MKNIKQVNCIAKFYIYNPNINRSKTYTYVAYLIVTIVYIFDYLKKFI